jgi:hypothetical protein
MKTFASTGEAKSHYHHGQEGRILLKLQHLKNKQESLKAQSFTQATPCGHSVRKQPAPLIFGGKTSTFIDNIGNRSTSTFRASKEKLNDG